jgi:hypothetical protein
VLILPLPAGPPAAVSSLKLMVFYLDQRGLRDHREIFFLENLTQDVFTKKSGKKFLPFFLISIPLVNTEKLLKN